MVHGGLSTVCMMVLKEVKTVHGGYYRLCTSQMVLKAANSVHIHNGLEMSQFTMSVPNGLERSHLWVLIFLLGLDLGLLLYSVGC